MNWVQELIWHMQLLTCASVSKRVFSQNLSYENEFDLHENEHVGVTHFNIKSLARAISYFDVI